MSAPIAPWTLGGSVHSNRKIIFAMEERRQVCSLVSPGKSKKAQFEADACLIVAAPELFAKVEIAAAIFEEYARLHLEKGTPEGNAKAKRNMEYALEMRAAVATARGEV